MWVSNSKKDMFVCSSRVVGLSELRRYLADVKCTLSGKSLFGADI